MRILNDNSSEFTGSLDSAGTEQIQRRRFLQGLIVAGFGLAGISSLSKHVFAQQFDDADAWRNQVTGFVGSVFDPYRAANINARIENANIARAPSPTDIHSAYSAPWIFTGSTIGTVKVICDNGFALDQFPLYDVQCPCRGNRDLNAAEIASITSSFERDRFGCVMAPNSPRMAAVEYNDHADFSNTVQQVYRRRPSDFRIHYKRHFTTHSGRTRRAFHVSDLAQVRSNGQPETKVFIGAEDI
jgi:hypothetical protein